MINETQTITEEKAVERVLEMFDDARSLVESEASRLYRSGAIDPEQWEDNYRLPRVILAAVLDTVGFQYRTLDADRREVENLKRF